MRYSLQTAKYVLKNLLYVLPLCVLPAILLACEFDEGAFKTVAHAVFEKGDLSFQTVYNTVAILNFHSLYSKIAFFLSFLVMPVCVSLIMAFTDKHMRIGKRTLHGIPSKLNDNFLPTLYNYITLVVIYEFFSLISSAVLFVCLQISVDWLRIFLFFALYLLLNGCFLYFGVSYLYLWLPTRLGTGFHAFESLRYAYQLVFPVRKKLFGGLFVAFIVITAGLVGVHTAYLYFPHWYFVVSAETLLFMFCVANFCTRMQVAYYDCAQLERADLKKYYMV